MSAHDAQATLMQGLGFAMVPVVLSLLLAAGTAAKVRVRARRASRARLAAMPAPAPEALDAGRGRLLAAIPQQRGGESGAR